MAETMKEKTLRVPGHAYGGYTSSRQPASLKPNFRAYCECGAISSRLDGPTSCKEWHRAHKEEIRKGEQHG